jgi:hypothetical protein
MACRKFEELGKVVAEMMGQLPSGLQERMERVREEMEGQLP